MCETTMMEKTALENVVAEKVKPLLKKAMREHFGVTIDEVQDDISDVLSSGRLFSVPGPDVPFKDAKRQFRKDFVKRLLFEHRGNVQRVARRANVDRRTIHRLLSEFHIDPDQFRSDVPRQDYSRVVAVQDIIQKTVDQYKGALNPERVRSFYQDAPSLSRQIMSQLPVEDESFDRVESLFEREYFSEALKQHQGNVRATAKSVGIAEETLHRKIKELGIQK